LNTIRILIYLNESKGTQQNKMLESLFRILSADESMNVTVLTKSKGLYEILTEKYAEEPAAEVLYQQDLQVNKQTVAFDLLFHLDYKTSNKAIPGVSYRILIPFFPKEALDDLSELHALLLSSYLLVDSLATRQVLERMDAFRGDILFLPAERSQKKPDAPINRRNLIRVETGGLSGEEDAKCEDVLKELRRESFVIHYGRHDTYYREQVSEDIAVLYNPAPRQLEMFYQLVNRNKPVIVKENDFF